MSESAFVDVGTFAHARRKPDGAELEYIGRLLLKFPPAQVSRMAGRSMALVSQVETDLCIRRPQRSLLDRSAPLAVPLSETPTRRAQVWRKSMPPAVKALIRVTIERYGVTYGEAMGPGRQSPVVRARQAAMCAVFDLGKYSYPKIGSWFGGRDHTTVMHAVRKRNAGTA